MAEYACLGYGSMVDNGCPKCGEEKIWFQHIGYPPGTPDTRVLIDVVNAPNDVIKKQTMERQVSISWHDNP